MGREGMQGSGGSYDDFALTITKAYFGPVDVYDGGESLWLHFEGTTNGTLEALPVMTAETFHPTWKCGAGWMTVDGGATARHDTRKSFHNNSSIISDLVNPAMDLVPTGPDDPFDDASSLDASIWVGHTFHFKSVVRKFKIEGEEFESERLVPSQWLGKGDSAAAPAPAAASVPAASGSANGDSKLLLAKLKVLAKKASNFDDFQAEALEVPGVADDDSILEQVLDESSGIWASAQS